MRPCLTLPCSACPPRLQHPGGQQPIHCKGIYKGWQVPPPYSCKNEGQSREQIFLIINFPQSPVVALDSAGRDQPVIICSQTPVQMCGR